MDLGSRDYVDINSSALTHPPAPVAGKLRIYIINGTELWSVDSSSVRVQY